MKELFKDRKQAAVDGLRWLGRGAALAAVSMLPASPALAAKANKKDTCTTLSSRVHIPRDVFREAGVLQGRIRHGESVGFNAAIDAEWSSSGTGNFKCVTWIPLERHVDGQDWLFSERFLNNKVSSAVVTPIPANHKDVINQFAEVPDSPQINEPLTHSGVLHDWKGQAYVDHIKYADGADIAGPFVAHTLELHP